MNKRITAVILSVMLGISTAACASDGSEAIDSAALPAKEEQELVRAAEEKVLSKNLTGANGTISSVEADPGADSADAQSLPVYGIDMDPELMQAMQEAFLGAVFSEASADGLSKEDFDKAQEVMNNIAESTAKGEDVSDKDMAALEKLIEKNKDNKLITSYYSAASAIDLINEYMNADEEKRAEMNGFLDTIMEYALASDAGSGGAYSGYIRKYLETQIGEQNFKTLCAFYTGFRQTYSTLSDSGKKTTRVFVKGTVQRCNEELTDEEWKSVNGAFGNIPGTSGSYGKGSDKEAEDKRIDSGKKLTPETVDLLFDLMDSGKLDPILLNEE